MKVRNGFVSNSSSSSFCIYGIRFNERDFNDVIENFVRANFDKIIARLKNNWWYKQHPERLPADEAALIEFYEDERYEFWEEFENETHLYSVGSDGGYRYFGRGWSGINDDETGAEFKKDVEEEIKRLFPGKTLECTTYEEVIYG